MRTIKRKLKNDIQDSSFFSRHFTWKKIIKVLLLLLLVLSMFFYRDTIQDIVEGIRNVAWSELGISIFLSFLGYLFEGLTISMMMGAVISRAKARDGIFIAFVCEFYRLTTLGNGSGIAEIHYLHEKKVEPGSATILTMIQYMMKRIAIMLFGMAGFGYLFCKETTRALCREYAAFMGTGCLITVVIIAFFLCLALSRKAADASLRILDWLSVKFRSKEESFGKWKEQILLLNRSGRSILDQKGRMFGVVLLQIGKLTAFYAIPAVFLGSKINLTAGECILIMAVAFMLAGVIPAPSGAGSLEFVFLLFFTCFVDSGMAVPAILLFRFATWICPAALGGVFLFVRRFFYHIGKFKENI